MTRSLHTTAIVLLVGLVLGYAAAQPEPFTEWHHPFEGDTEGWITDTTPGEEGWCGEIENRDATRGSREASEGEGYAVVRPGPCNDYWRDFGFDAATGPYSPGAGYPRAWPEGGYTSEIDVYLDPEEGTDFTLAQSVVLEAPADPENAIRYFFTSVVAEEAGLTVLGEGVTEPGWYTLRHVFGDEEGMLTVNAELVRDGEVVASAPVRMTAMSGEETSSFEVDSLGSGYTWFASIGEGTEVAIDEHRVRRSD